MDRWVGKIALVTGAGGGIGAAITEALAKAGVIVYGLDIRVEKIEELKLKLGDGKVIPLKGDIRKECDIIAAFMTIREDFGRIHILVNNAGIVRFGFLSDGDPKLFKDVMDVNVTGAVLCTQQALKLMKVSDVDDGHIININSITGHVVPNTINPILNVYPASKHAITALTKSLRSELAFMNSNIRVTSISPGYVETELATAGRAASTPLQDSVFEGYNGVKKLKAKDIADAVLYVLSTPLHTEVHELTLASTGAVRPNLKLAAAAYRNSIFKSKY